MRKLMIALALLMVAVTACVAVEPAPVSKPVAVYNEFEDGELVITQAVTGEDFGLKTTFSTDYKASEWHVTDGKILKMTAVTTGLPEVCEVFVEHLHIDVLLVAKTAILHGIKQDSMDDSLHTGSQLGFYIDDTTPYENMFSIEGYSETLISGWGYFNSSYGYVNIEETRLTERNLIKRGATGTKFQMAWDLLVKCAGDEFYHGRSLVTEFTVPISTP